MIKTSTLDEIVEEFLSTRRYKVIEEIEREEKDYLSLICLLLRDPEWKVRLKATETLVNNKYWLWDRKGLVDSVTKEIIHQLIDEHSLTRDKVKESLRIIPLNIISNVIQPSDLLSSLSWKLTLLFLSHTLGFNSFNLDIKSLIRDLKKDKSLIPVDYIYLFNWAVKDYIESLDHQEALTWAYPLLEEEYPYSEYMGIDTQDVLIKPPFKPSSSIELEFEYAGRATPIPVEEPYS